MKTLIPWYRIFIEKFIVLQLVSRFSPLLWNTKFQHCVYKNPSLDPNLVHPFTQCFFKIHFIIILSPTSTCPKRSLPMSYSDQNSVRILQFPHTCYMLSPYHHLLRHRSKSMWYKVHAMKLRRVYNFSILSLSKVRIFFLELTKSLHNSDNIYNKFRS
jgi:hypothetical protein